MVKERNGGGHKTRTEGENLMVAGGKRRKRPEEGNGREKGNYGGNRRIVAIWRDKNRFFPLRWMNAGVRPYKKKDGMNLEFAYNKGMVMVIVGIWIVLMERLGSNSIKNIIQININYSSHENAHCTRKNVNLLQINKTYEYEWIYLANLCAKICGFF